MNFLSGAHRGNVDRKKPYLSCDTYFPDLINEDFPGAMSVYYDKLVGVGGRARKSRGEGS